MSATSEPAHSEPARWLNALRQRLAQSGQRRLVWVQGDAAFTRRWAQAALAGAGSQPLLWIGPEADIQPAQAQHYLGREYRLLVWDARSGLHPDGFGAIAGTLQGGGVLLLLTPDAREWPHFDDPDYRRLASSPGDKHFLERLARVLGEAPTVLPVIEAHPLPELPTVQSRPPQPLPTADQRQALTAILKVREGHRRRPLVITADRGRGKSAVMGIAAASLLAREPLEIIVTAARPAALQSFWRHASDTVAGHADTGEEAVLQPGDSLQRNGGRIRYLAPSRLLEEAPRADLLLVDEAAALPVPILKTLLQRFARVVFASTVHGYEGSGRGFALRFREYLTEAAPGWQALTLEQPVRWAQGDPLEALLNRLLLMDAELPEPAETAGDLTLTAWPRSMRHRHEKRLSEVFGLLVNAHYQTSPDDLRLLLDDPGSHCVLALQGETVVGAVWAMAEGGLDAELAEQVRCGRRRTRGQLLPQALAAYGGDSAAATLNYWRIVRIAVHPDWRRRGIGDRLVAAVAESAAEAGIDILGTSFGVSSELVGFWQRCGMECLRLGLRRDAASGAHSLMLGRGLTESGRNLCERHRRRFAEHWPGLLTTELQDLEPDLAWHLSAAWCPSGTPWTEQDRLEVADFAHSSRPFALTRLPLQRMTWRYLASSSEAFGPELELWCRAVLQQVPESRWQAEGLASGRKDAYARLRATAAWVFATLPGPSAPDSTST